MDTVWIRLTLTGTKFLVNGAEKPMENKSEYFMFGPTGIVRFNTRDGMTALFGSNSSASVAMVEEDSEHIMEILRRIRKTGGRVEQKSKKKKRTARR